jgi:hypothetical protein
MDLPLEENIGGIKYVWQDVDRDGILSNGKMFKPCLITLKQFVKTFYGKRHTDIIELKLRKYDKKKTSVKAVNPVIHS